MLDKISALVYTLLQNSLVRCPILQTILPPLEVPAQKISRGTQSGSGICGCPEKAYARTRVCFRALGSGEPDSLVRDDKYWSAQPMLGESLSVLSKSSRSW